MAKKAKIQDSPEEIKQKKQQKTIKILVAILILITFYGFIAQLIQTYRHAGDEDIKPQRQTFAGLEIPREVYERMERVKSNEDKNKIFEEWYTSEGISIETKQDGSQVAIRDGQEYVIREPDPDYVPQENNDENIEQGIEQGTQQSQQQDDDIDIDLN